MAQQTLRWSLSQGTWTGSTSLPCSEPESVTRGSMGIPGSDWLEVPTINIRPIYIYILGLNFREYPHNSYGLKNGPFTYLHQLDPGTTIDPVSELGCGSKGRLEPELGWWNSTLWVKKTNLDQCWPAEKPAPFFFQGVLQNPEENHLCFHSLPSKDFPFPRPLWEFT